MAGTLTFCCCLCVLYWLGQEREDVTACDSGVWSAHARDGEYCLVKLVAFSSNEDCLLTFLSYIGGKDCWQKEKQERKDRVSGALERLRQWGRHVGAGAAPGELWGIHPWLQPAPQRETEGGELGPCQQSLPQQRPEADLQVHPQQPLQDHPQSTCGRQRSWVQKQPAVGNQPEVQEKHSPISCKSQEHGPCQVRDQDSRA